MLEKVRYWDYNKKSVIDAYTDGYAYDAYSHLYLISVVGHDSSVKAITSALLIGKYITILSRPPCRVRRSFLENYRVLSTKLKSGFLHQIITTSSLFKSNGRKSSFLYIDKEQNIEQDVFKYIKENYATPLIPAWSGWLYKKLKEKNIENLSGNKKLIRITADEEFLDSLVSEGIKNKEIDF
jgi:hypothetical protein